MDDQGTTNAPKRRPPSRKGKRGKPNATSWRPGQSGNPRGRPRSPSACAERIRELVDPKEWIEYELSIARDATKLVEQRSSAWHALIDRGFVRPPTTSVHVDLVSPLAIDYSKMPLDLRLAELERRRALLGPGDVIDVPEESAGHRPVES